MKMVKGLRERRRRKIFVLVTDFCSSFPFSFFLVHRSGFFFSLFFCCSSLSLSLKSVVSQLSFIFCCLCLFRLRPVARSRDELFCSTFLFLFRLYFFSSKTTDFSAARGKKKRKNKKIVCFNFLFRFVLFELCAPHRE